MRKSLFLAGVLIASLLFAFSICGADALRPEKVIVDCDANTMNDDILAISFLLRMEERGEVEIMGITLTGGNTFVEAEHKTVYGIQPSSSETIKKFLTAVGRTDIPVYEGTDIPLGYSFDSLEKLGGEYRKYEENGELKPRTMVKDVFGAMWHFEDPTSGELVDKNDAADFMIETVKANPGQVTIFAIGPVCNIGRAVLKDAEFAPAVKAVYYMAGAFGELLPNMKDFYGNTIDAVKGANLTNYTEYNVYYDVNAFAAVITADFPEQFIFPGDCREFVPEGLGKMLSDEAPEAHDAILQMWIDYHLSFTQDYPYWDPMTVYGFAHPEKFSSVESGYITINTDPKSEEWGRTSIISKSVFDQLNSAEKENYGQAVVIHRMDDFWDFAFELLCKEPVTESVK